MDSKACLPKQYIRGGTPFRSGMETSALQGFSFNFSNSHNLLAVALCARLSGFSVFYEIKYSRFQAVRFSELEKRHKILVDILADMVNHQ